MTRYRLAGVLLLVAMWTYVVAILTSPKASISEVCSWWLAGIVLAAAAWLAYEWGKELWSLQLDDMPSTSQELAMLAVMGVLLPCLLIVFAVTDSALVTSLRYRWREWRDRKVCISERGLIARVKGLRHDA